MKRDLSGLDGKDRAIEMELRAEHAKLRAMSDSDFLQAFIAEVAWGVIEHVLSTNDGYLICGCPEIDKIWEMRKAIAAEFAVGSIEGLSETMQDEPDLDDDDWRPMDRMMFERMTRPRGS